MPEIKLSPEPDSWKAEQGTTMPAFTSDAALPAQPPGEPAVPLAICCAGWWRIGLRLASGMPSRPALALGGWLGRAYEPHIRHYTDQ